ncbi:integrase [Bordetella bronchialis]|uniref:integrase n=1 Tax=Bordetella bronchialis TaxID=463025 RepID=UPI001E5C3B22|nr:integrase [Bordetella bronchialis]
MQSGTPLLVLKELGGWKKIEMVLKYAHLAPDHLSHHAHAVTFLSQQDAQKEKPPARAVLSA